MQAVKLNKAESEIAQGVDPSGLFSQLTIEEVNLVKSWLATHFLADSPASVRSQFDSLVNNRLTYHLSASRNTSRRRLLRNSTLVDAIAEEFNRQLTEEIPALKIPIESGFVNIFARSLAEFQTHVKQTVSPDELSDLIKEGGPGESNPLHRLDRKISRYFRRIQVLCVQNNIPLIVSWRWGDEIYAPTGVENLTISSLPSRLPNQVVPPTSDFRKYLEECEKTPKFTIGLTVYLHIYQAPLDWKELTPNQLLENPRVAHNRDYGDDNEEGSTIQSFHSARYALNNISTVSPDGVDYNLFNNFEDANDSSLFYTNSPAVVFLYLKEIQQVIKTLNRLGIDRYEDFPEFSSIPAGDESRSLHQDP